MIADEIKAILQKRHSNLWRWICVTELRATTGLYYPLRIIDVFAMALIPSMNYERIAYEIKVSRADWLSEIRNPRKRARAIALSNRFFFVLAYGIYRKGDLPKEDPCGILEITPEKQIKLIRRAKRRKIKPMPIGFIAALARRIKQENQ